MGARLLLDERHVLTNGDEAYVELVLWQLKAPMPKSKHRFKYRFALVVNGVCVVRYDNEINKGDHKHIEDRESKYEFTTPEALASDFWGDVERWRSDREDRND